MTGNSPNQHPYGPPVRPREWYQQPALWVAVVAAIVVWGGVAATDSPEPAADTATSDTGAITTDAPTTTRPRTTTTTRPRTTTTTRPRTTTTTAPTTTTTTAPPTTTTTVPPTTTTTAPPEDPQVANARRSAQSYLDISGFSRQGLIDQLSSEYGDQYPVEAATAAVDSLNVDWNAQAVRAAESYLEFSGFSHAGLVDQLASEYGDQFTREQAEHGASVALGA